MTRTWNWTRTATGKVLLGLALALIVMVGARTALDRTLTTAIRNEAVEHASHIAEDFRSTFPELRQMAKAGPVDPEVLDRMSQFLGVVDTVIQVKIHNAQGDLRYIHDEDTWVASGGPLASPEVRESLATGQVVVRPQGPFDTAGKSITTVQMATPLRDETGTIFAFFEIVVDHSHAAASFRKAFEHLLIFLPILTAISVVVPSLALAFLQSQRGEEQRLVQRLKRRDALTGLMNRTTFSERALAIFTLRKKPPLQHGLILIDINQFRAVNETHGHRVGDAFLQHVADCLKRALRHEDLVARFDGDEFVAVLPYVLPIELEQAAQRIRAQLNRQYRHGDIKLTCHACIGAHLARPGETLDDAMQCAELALCHAKASGTDLVVVYSSDLNRQAERRRQVEAALRDAWDNDRAHLVFQPVIDARSRRVAGFEALLRLVTTDGNPISPAEFVPIAEKTGLIRELGRLTLQHAMRAARNWPDDTFVAVNLSPAQFRHGDLVDDVRWLLETLDFPASRLEFEITESLLLDEEPDTRAQFDGLKKLGVSIAMDDFGTGYSSLSYLLAHDFDKLKIDRSFLDDLQSNPARQQKLLRSIIDLGHQIDLSVTMEGVETAEQVTMLDGLKCDFYQGFYFSRPLEAASVLRLLASEAGGAA